MYQKDKEVRRLDKAGKDDKTKQKDKNSGKCKYCDKDRHPYAINGSKFGWKERCPAKNAICKDCKKVGCFNDMPTCRLNRISCIKIEPVNMAKSTNVEKIMARGPSENVPINVEADTGANITLLKAEILKDLDRVQIESTDMYIRGYNGVA